MCYFLRFVSLAVIVLSLVSPAAAQDAVALVKEGQKLLQSGDAEGAQARFEAAAKANPKSFDAHYALGRVLDLRGRYAAARHHLEEAGALATAQQQKEQVTTAIAVSYAFERKPDSAAASYERIYDPQVAENQLDGAAATANAIARVYLESGDIDKAEEWYRTGFETAKQIPQLKAEELDLWEFRWLHAQARIAARRGTADAAWKHAAAAKAVFDKGSIEDQAPQVPYLMGYVAFYSGDFPRAIKELQAADQRDAFILGLIARAYEKLGQPEQAAAYHQKVLGTSSHNINAAFSRPEAMKYLEKR
jgi:tetratricopeptide (TPR) repeat protein